MNANNRKYSSEETVRLGREIYERDIRPLVEAEHKGKFLVVDIETGDYEMDSKDINACLRLLERRPNAETLLLRIGYPTAHTWLRMTRQTT